MELQEVHLWTIWTKPAHTSSLKQKEGEIGERRVSREVGQTITYSNSSLRSISRNPNLCSMGPISRQALL
jgi:hypothetical protein